MDNSGAMEYGQISGQQYGPNDDTFAYNKFINNGNVSFVSVTGTYACSVSNLHFWNNIIIENVNSRFSGPNFGQDVLGDGQSMTSWYGWIPSSAGHPPSYPWSRNYYNSPSYSTLGYNSETPGGTNIIGDTVYDSRNNIIWASTGLNQMLPSTRPRLKHANNVYRLSGGSTLGCTLNTGNYLEVSTADKVYIDTSNANPLNWNVHLGVGSPAINFGKYTGVSPDYGGIAVANPPDAGIYELYGAPSIITDPVTSFVQLRAQGGGNITNDGGSPVVKRGLVWSTSPNPTIYLNPNEYKLGTTSTGTGIFTNTYVNQNPLAPLLPNTTYYVRAYAINSTDTGYGNQVIFTTLPIVTNQKYYFSSSTGNDANTGTSSASPWKTLSKLNSLMIVGNVTFQPGDSIFFKRGDVFANGNDAYASCWWVNRAINGYTAPSGTQSKPIVITNYGDQALQLPNLIFPYPSVISTSQHNVLVFEGVSWIVIDGLQFNDNRSTNVTIADKKGIPTTTGAMQLGVWTQSKIVGADTIMGSSSNPVNRNRMVSNCTVKNCLFNNMTYGFVMVAGINTNITNNTFTNMKSSKDTGGTNDVLGCAIEACYGFNLNISRNLIKGSWAMSGITGSSKGLGGVAIDLFTVRNSKIAYNTIIDCSGFLEMGNIDNYDTTTGAQYDTIAFNKIINSGQIAYVHGVVGDAFKGHNKKLAFWNNIVIENNKSRMSGVGFGLDTYGDGQSYTQNWYWGGPTTCSTSNVPTNPTSCNQDYRSVIAYKIPQLGNPDTLIDFRNNIIYATNGGQMIYEPARTEFKRNSNIYYIKGGFGAYSTRLGGTASYTTPTVAATLNANERIINTKIFIDTTSAFPENWDLHILDTSYAKAHGIAISGFTTDFAGIPLSGTMDIGLYKYSLKPVIVLVSVTGITCKTRTDGTITVSASGGTSPYTYKLNNGLYQSSASFIGLAANTYTVTVKDSKGALGTLTATVKGSSVVICP
jgi:hypothetical protein